MKTERCRICGSDLPEKPLLTLVNVPSRAQFLPVEKELRKDRGINLKIFQCRFCGVVQLSNNPVSYYRSVIRATGISDEMRSFREKTIFRFCKKNIHSLEKKIIEIGCGAGEYLSIMNNTGAITYGIEYENKLVKECRKKGLKVSKDFIASSDHILKNRPFDAFFTLNYLEHLPYPCETLKGIFNNLKEDAAGIVEVPNFDMILRKIFFLSLCLTIFFIFQPRH